MGTKNATIWAIRCYPLIQPSINGTDNHPIRHRWDSEHRDKPMRHILAALACLIIGCAGAVPDTFQAQKDRVISNWQNAPGMEYCELSYGVDPGALELCIHNAPDEATINHTCIGTQQRYQVIEGCQYMAKTIVQSRQLP